MASNAPPPYARTVYDDTLRSRFYDSPYIGSMATRPNLIGHLEHHSPTTDGSFSICIAGGKGVFISKGCPYSNNRYVFTYHFVQVLLESIPAEHHPALDTDYKPDVETLTSGTMTSIGTTFIPLILTNQDTGEKVRIVLCAIVLPNLYMNMFIGTTGGQLVRSTAWQSDGPLFGFNFGPGRDDVTYVRGI